MAAPRGAPPQPPRPREVELTALSVGMWSSRSHSSLSLLLLPASLVLLADRTAAVRASTSAAVLSQLGAKSPFHSTFYKGGCVCAFEVPLAAICGLDYTNPLCQPGRVVVEAHGMRKREFKTVRAHAAAGCRPARVHPLQPALSAPCSGALVCFCAPCVARRTVWHTAP